MSVDRAALWWETRVPVRVWIEPHFGGKQEFHVVEKIGSICEIKEKKFRNL